jgi:hypothetical protein
MPVTTRNPSASNEVVRSAATDSTALAEAPSAWRIVMLDMQVILVDPQPVGLMDRAERFLYVLA